MRGEEDYQMHTRLSGKQDHLFEMKQLVQQAADFLAEN